MQRFRVTAEPADWADTGAAPGCTRPRSIFAEIVGWFAGVMRTAINVSAALLKGSDPEICAEAFDAQRRADEARGEWIDPRIGRPPFREYAPVWIKSRLHKTGTADSYHGHLKNLILPAFGAFGIAAIRPTMVQQWVKDLQSVKGLAPRTIETIYVIFASIMRGAVRDGYIRKTPCTDIRRPAASSQQDRCPATDLRTGSPARGGHAATFRTSCAARSRRRSAPR